MAISVQMYQWESVAQLYLMHPLFQIFCICKIFCYSTLLYLFWDKYMGLGSSIWGVVGLSHWNGTVSAFCRQNANSFRKSADLQPLLGLGAPAPFGCISNPTFKPFPQYCCQVAKKYFLCFFLALVVEILCYPALSWNKYLEKFLVCNSSLGNLGWLKVWRWKKGV